ncbi:MAG: hypothetical protein M3P51_01635 [Chloroflexota bacterium]|nr:hypothetical protein [Chloroflexota bacterium]
MWLAGVALRGEGLVPLGGSGLAVGPGIRLASRTFPYGALRFETRLESESPVWLYLHGAAAARFVLAAFGISLRF